MRKIRFSSPVHCDNQSESKKTIQDPQCAVLILGVMGTQKRMIKFGIFGCTTLCLKYLEKKCAR